MSAYRPDIDGLRALAIGSVVLYHAAPSVAPGGYIGVDIFFVISGYLITGIIFNELREGRFSFSNFYVRRARRILPASILMISTVTVVCFAVMEPGDLINYGRLLIYTVLFGANFRLASAPSYFDASMRENPLLHMWSLAVEEQFYIFWPLLLALCFTALRPSRVRFMMLSLFMASIAVSMALVFLMPRSAFYHLPSRAWELLAGALPAIRAVPEVRGRTLAGLLSGLSLVLMLPLIFLYDDKTVFPGLAALPPVLGSALFIHAQSAHRTAAGAIFSLSPMVFIGRISYSLYLWHWPLLALATYISFTPLTSLQMTGLVVLSIAAATVSWRYVERPFRAPALSIRRRISFLYSATALVAVLAACGSVFQESRGALWRYSAEARALLARPPSIGLPKGSCVTFREFDGGLFECKTKGASEDIILWGDSHAGHYSPAVAAAMGSVTLVGKLGCLPLSGLGAAVGASSEITSQCAKAQEAALKLIREKKPRLVILASAWDSHYDSHVQTYLKASGAKDRAHFERQFFLSASNLIAELNKTGAQVLIFTQVPEISFSVRKCIGFASLLGSDIHSCEKIAKETNDLRQRVTNKIFVEIAWVNSALSVFNAASVLCDEKYCYGARDGKLLYFDTNHLSIDGSLVFVDAVRNAIQDKLARTRAAQAHTARPAADAAAGQGRVNFSND